MVRWGFIFPVGGVVLKISSTVTSRNTPTHIPRKPSARVTTPNNRKRSSRAISPGRYGVRVPLAPPGINHRERALFLVPALAVRVVWVDF